MTLTAVIITYNKNNSKDEKIQGRQEQKQRNDEWQPKRKTSDIIKFKLNLN